MGESNSGKIVWSIKKNDFISGKFDDATFELGNTIWSLTSKNENPLQGDTLSFTVSDSSKTTTTCTLFSCFQASGIICLEGLGGRFSAMRAWDWLESDDEQLKVDTSVLSFDDKYLFSDGTYRIGFTIRQDSFFVDFASPDHSLILGPSDAGCLQIEERKLYISKSYFSAQSPYFKALFFGDFKEKTQEVIVLNDVKFDTFKEFLKYLYAEFRVYYRVNYEAIPDVLALADMFLCNTVTRSCEMMLAEKKSFTVVDIELADKYRLYYLRSRAIAQVPIADLKKYLAQKVDSAEAMCTRHFIIDRIEKEARR